MVEDVPVAFDIYTSRVDPDTVRFDAFAVVQRLLPEPVQVILPVPKLIARTPEPVELKVPVDKLKEPSDSVPVLRLVDPVEAIVKLSNSVNVPPPLKIRPLRTELLVRMLTEPAFAIEGVKFAVVNVVVTLRSSDPLITRLPDELEVKVTVPADTVRLAQELDTPMTFTE
jgi:hypothetical protein